MSKYQEFPQQIKNYKSWLEFCKLEAKASFERVGYLQEFLGDGNAKTLEYNNDMKVFKNDIKVREVEFELAEKYVTEELLPILKDSLAAMA